MAHFTPPSPPHGPRPPIDILPLGDKLVPALTLDCFNVTVEANDRQGGPLTVGNLICTHQKMAFQCRGFHDLGFMKKEVVFSRGDTSKHMNNCGCRCHGGAHDVSHTSTFAQHFRVCDRFANKHIFTIPAIPGCDAGIRTALRLPSAAPASSCC